MPLTELIIDGFKSFAEKTTIHFGKGITGIVGPNGSGKSNITEAIRFAMGESRVKTLRGSNMKDVIFAGSELRKPLNRAEVTLVFDNKKRDLAFNSDQVAVTRRIFRSGDSSYLINNQEVRLRDVHELFLDSGISQNSLAIISQGRVDQILNSKPEDRRGIFEEAAGVLHFKEQKQLAESQLAKTNDNLIRINDLVKELEGRLTPLEEQSSLAKEYKFQKAGLDKKLKTLLAFQIEVLNQQKEDLAKQAEQNKQLLSKLDDEVKESQSAVSAKRKEYEKVQAQRDQMQQQLLSLSDQLSNLNAKLQVAEQSKQFDEATKNEYQTQARELKEQIDTLKDELADFDKQKVTLTNEQSNLKNKRKQLTDQLKENPEQLNQKLDDQRNEYIQLLQDQTSNNNQIVYLNSEVKRLKEDTSYQNNDVSVQLNQASEELKQLKNKGQKLAEQRKTLQEKADSLAKKTQDTQQKLDYLREVATKERNELQQVSARREALINIQKRHEGYYYGVRNVLNHQENYPGVIGVIGELLTFPSQLEAAMTTALGGGVQDLVTQTRVSARDAINTLKRSHAGRATFLPLDGLRQYRIPSSTITTLQSFPGYQGIASELVNSNTEIDISSAIQYLLGTVIIVDTIETALQISRRVNRYRIVTLDGDVISPGGSMTGGQRNQRNNSPLQTTAEINKLGQKLSQLKKQFEEDRSSLADLTEQQETISSKKNELASQLQELNQNLNEAALSYQNQEKEVKRLQDASDLYNSRISERTSRLKDLQAQIKAAKKKQDELDQQAIKEKDLISKIQLRIKNFTELNQKVQEQVKKIDPEIAVYTNKLENLSNRQEERQRQLTNSSEQLKSLREKLTTLSNNGKLSIAKKQKLNEDKTNLTAKRTQVQQQVNQISGQLGQFDAQINQLDQVASRNYDLRKDAAVEQEEFSVKITKLNASIDQKLSTLSEDYSLTYEAALEQAEGENTEEERVKLAKSVKLHRMSIEDIGPVNLDSIEEYEKVKKRYDFLNSQQNDLLNARNNLEQSMTELDKEVKTRFSETFKQIAVSFTKIFPVVFNGGRANLVLTEPDDMLSTGVEIIAQPPGKKLQRLSLLSGGERALTAITLLFAMLKVNPVPFCILDEVEAALDDANVTRFAEFLQRYDMHTQFIVITHRRGTMTKANQLFGVVMQESGVSQVLSVSLKDIKDEVN